MANLTNSAKLIEEMDKKAYKTELPTVNNGTLKIKKNGTQVGNTFSANSAANIEIDLAIPTSANDIGALSNSTKYGASLSLSIDSSTYIITAQLKDQDGNNLGTAQTIDLPLESVVVSGSYNANTKKVVLTLKDGSTIDFSVADLISGLQAEITSTNKLNADLIQDGTTNKVVTATEKSTWNGKQAALSTDQLNAVNSGITSDKVNTYDGYAVTIGNKANTSDVLTKTNTTAFTPTGDYQPATKKYVDDNIGGISWEEKTGSSIELGLRTIINTESNITITVPSSIKDGEEYVLRCINVNSYTLTLGDGFTNPFGVDLTLSANATDQFVFLAVQGTLELQPQVVISDGTVSSLVAGSTASTNATTATLITNS